MLARDHAFQEAMRDKFIGEVRRVTGRNVLAFISNHSVGPDMEIELFFLESALGPDPRPGGG